MRRERATAGRGIGTSGDEDQIKVANLDALAFARYIENRARTSLRAST